MARIRSIKPDFWTSEQIMECSLNARLLFIGMWNFADDTGRLPLAPKTIKAQVFPGDDISAENILGMIQELSGNGLVLPYEVDGKEFLLITGWQHQRIDKPQASKYPAPINGLSKTIRGMVATDRKGKEEIGKEESSLRSDSARETAPKRATRLLADAVPSERNIQDAASAGLAQHRIQSEWAKMRDWSRSARNGACLDWDARWRNWCKTATEGRGTGPPQRRSGPQTMAELAADLHLNEQPDDHAEFGFTSSVEH